MVFDDYNIKEEFLKMLPLQGRTRGEDIYRIFKQFAIEEKLPLQKLVSITTDGAPAMKAINKGFIAYCKKDPDIPKINTYHCIIHQQALCGKSLKMREVMELVIKIVNSIRAKALQRRQFRSLLVDMESEYSELPLHTEVRWLSKGRVLKRFLELSTEIKSFLKERGDFYEELNDANWILNLAFLTDITSLLNELNLSLQGKNKYVSQMISSINSFKSKLQIIISQLQKKKTKHLPCLTNEIAKHDGNSDIMITAMKDYVDLLEGMKTEFDDRFQDFKKLEPIVTFFSYPFVQNDIETLAEEIENVFNIDTTNLEDEFIILQNDLDLKARRNEPDFWNFVSAKKYPIFKKIALMLNAYFSSTYLCESTFSSMKHIKCKNRSVISNEHLDDCLRLAVTNYVPNYELLANEMQCKTSNDD